MSTRAEISSPAATVAPERARPGSWWRRLWARGGKTPAPPPGPGIDHADHWLKTPLRVYAGRLWRDFGARREAGDDGVYLGLMRVDRTRRLFCLAAVAADAAASFAFRVDGREAAPRYQRYFYRDLPDGTRAHVRLFWLAYGEGFASCEAFDGDGAALGVYVLGKRLARLEAEHIVPPPRRPRQYWNNRLVRLAVAWPPIKRRYAGCWLFVDRDFKADDNAEHLYRWVARHHPERRIFFALRRDSPDWQRLAAEGFRLIDIASLHYLYAFLHADWLISSNITGYITRPRTRNRYRDRCNLKFCFLQHGIIKDYLPLLFHTPMELLATTTRREYDSLAVEPRWGYSCSPKETFLTGLPRHDELKRRITVRKKPTTILFMPTWRNFLATRPRNQGRYAYDATFHNSLFSYTWRRLLGSDELHAAANRHGFSLVLLPHPCLHDANLNAGHDGVTTLSTTQTGILDVLADTALLITDYSSIAMDVALIDRAVLYYQFDRESFYNGGHTYTQGYFDYERDGFGDMATEHDEIVRLAVECIENGCVMKEEYRKRADAFFAFRDQNNCQRVYDAILACSAPDQPEPA